MSKKDERNISDELIEAAKEIKAHKEGRLHPKIVRNVIIIARIICVYRRVNLRCYWECQNEPLSNGSKTEESRRRPLSG